ncbi:hypothetical protein [Streptomyces canus]|uniref:nSTAND1 domain-containing NTPase n=1 Tax=Streptomyces canus TaxID=58343 RepID=UPI002DD98A6F|nr:hypothetical protein [Streptomyces canus]
MLGNLAQQQRLTLLLGPSGSGKSSLIQAGVLRALADGKSSHRVLRVFIYGPCKQSCTLVRGVDKCGAGGGYMKRYTLPIPGGVEGSWSHSWTSLNNPGRGRLPDLRPGYAGSTRRGSAGLRLLRVARQQHSHVQAITTDRRRSRAAA